MTFNEILYEMTRRGELITDLEEIPLLSIGTQAGVPNSGDDEIDGAILHLAQRCAGNMTYAVPVNGESMQGVGILSGDVLVVDPSRVPRDNDIVVAWLNDGSTVKTYCRDPQGHVWLVPANDRFEPRMITADDQFSIFGVVIEILRRFPSAPALDTAQRIREAQQRMASPDAPNPPSVSQIAAALRQVMPQIRIQRHWYAIYRVLADRHVITANDFRGFGNLMREVLGDSCPKLNLHDLRSMAVDSFAMPVSKWNVNDAPVSSSRYFEYLELAHSFDEKL